MASLCWCFFNFRFRHPETGLKSVETGSLRRRLLAVPSHWVFAVVPNVHRSNRDCAECGRLSAYGTPIDTMARDRHADHVTQPTFAERITALKAAAETVMAEAQRMEAAASSPTADSKRRAGSSPSLRNAGGTSAVAPLDIALQAADQVGMPVICHIDFPPPSYEEVLQRLRPGDVLTHAFRPFPERGMQDIPRRARARQIILFGKDFAPLPLRLDRRLLVSRDVAALRDRGRLHRSVSFNSSRRLRR
jgi:hypothetical protein